MGLLASKNVLTADNLECVRGERTLFSNLTFNINSGKILYIQGENGSGKTTLLRTLSGLSQAQNGQVNWNSQNIQTIHDEFNLIWV